MSTVLDKIVVSKRQEIAAARDQVSESELGRRIGVAPAVRDFAAALTSARDIALIAEIKRASPSAGVIRHDFEPVSLAQTYAAHGASAISVLTDGPFFQGRLEYLTQVRHAVPVPVLRKDFVLDRYQIIEARVAGADAVLLIAEILPGDELVGRLRDIHEFGMEALVELYDVENLQRVVDSGARVIGINNRDLRTFETDLSRTTRLAQQIPRDRILVSESGIRDRGDIDRIKAAGARAILVGESLMRAANVGAAVDELLGLV